MSQATAIIYIFEGMGHYRSCALTLLPQVEFNSCIISIALNYRKSITGGLLSGACTEQRLARHLLFFSCRYHMAWQSAAFLSTCDLEPFCMINTKAALFH